MRALRSCLFAFFLLLPTIAFAQKVTTDFDHKANFSQYKTFMWLREPRVRDPLMRRRVMDAVNAQLTAKGLQLVTDGADLSVIANGSTMQEQNLRDVLHRVRWMGLARVERWVRDHVP